ncbi:hypothetical protein [Listeria sp. PSOL-1]|uniref:hypothetical protein n=1 Tax=Listeria sp. PSOL-1 TaxID=1844999 RepID=UPI0013CFA0F5|nr:hypothetical protein [Listeria sp. PSOL-1]
MVKQILYFLRNEDTKIVDYWFSTYYMRSEEYALRKEYPEYLIRKKETVLWLFHKIESSLDHGYLNTSTLYHYGEDAKDIKTPLQSLFHNVIIYL